MSQVVPILLLFVVFGGCSQRSNDTRALLVKPLPANRLEVVVNDYGQTDLKRLDIQPFEFNTIPASQWQEAYGKFGMALVNEAKKNHFDSESLSNCLVAVLTSPESKGLALLPVAAVSGSLDGRKIWMIHLQWETSGPFLSNQPMGHVRTHSFTQNGVKQVAFSTCR